MITARSGVIIAGTASAVLVVLAARRLHGWGGYGLLAAIAAGTVGIRAACHLGGVLLAAAALDGLILRWLGSCVGFDWVPHVSFGAVFAPGEPD